MQCVEVLNKEQKLQVKQNGQYLHTVLCHCSETVRAP